MSTSKPYVLDIGGNEQDYLDSLYIVLSNDANTNPSSLEVKLRYPMHKVGAKIPTPVIEREEGVSDEAFDQLKSFGLAEYKSALDKRDKKDTEYVKSQVLASAKAYELCSSSIQRKILPVAISRGNLLEMLKLICMHAEKNIQIIPAMAFDVKLTDICKLHHLAAKSDFNKFVDHFVKLRDELSVDVSWGQLTESGWAARFLNCLKHNHFIEMHATLKEKAVSTMLSGNGPIGLSDVSEEKSGGVSDSGSGGGGGRGLGSEPQQFVFPGTLSAAIDFARVWNEQYGPRDGPRKPKPAQDTGTFPMSMANVDLKEKSKDAKAPAGQTYTKECWKCRGSQNKYDGLGQHRQDNCPLSRLSDEVLAAALRAAVVNDKERNGGGESESVKTKQKGFKRRGGKGKQGDTALMMTQLERDMRSVSNSLKEDGIPVVDDSFEGLVLPVLDSRLLQTLVANANNHLFMLDGGVTGTAVIVNEAYATEVKTLPKARRIQTGNGIVEATEGCSTKYFGTMQQTVLLRNAGLNLLGESWMRSRYKYEEDKTSEPPQWKSVTLDNGTRLLFEHRRIGDGGCWIADLEHLLKLGVFHSDLQHGVSQNATVERVLHGTNIVAIAGRESVNFEDVANVDADSVSDEEIKTQESDRVADDVGATRPPPEPPPLSKKQRQGIDFVKQAERRMGYQSYADLAYHARTGSVLNLHFTAADVHRAQEERERRSALLKGKHQYERAPAHHFDDMLESRELLLEADLMFVGEHVFLIVITIPGNYSMMSYLGAGKGARSSTVFEKPLRIIFARLKSYGWNVRMFAVDGEGGIAAASLFITELGIMFLPQVKGAHLNTIDNRIKVVKQRMRCYWMDLKFKMIGKLIPWLANTSNYSVNISTCRANEARVPPFVFITGQRPDFDRDLQATFGDYVESHEHHGVLHNRVDKPRSFSCMHLSSAPELGVHYLLNLDTMAVIRRDKFTVMNEGLPEKYLLKFKELAAGKGLVIDEYILPTEVIVAPPAVVRYNTEHEVGVDDDDIDEVKVDDNDNDILHENDNIIVREREETLYVPPVVEAGVREIRHEITQIAGPTEGTESMVAEAPRVQFSVATEVPRVPVLVVENTEKPSPRKSGRNRVHPSARNTDFAYVCGIDLALAIAMSPGAAVKKHGLTATESLAKQIRTVIGNATWHPVHRSDIPAGMPILPSHMFVTEKMNPDNGKLEEVKSRIVVGGNHQDRSMYTESETSAPTAKTESIFCIAAIASAEKRKIMTFDIGAAFVKSDMKGVVYIYLNKFVANIVCDMDPAYKKFLLKDGRLIVKLDKALYGCIEAAKLWYDNISAFFISVKYFVNQRDVCVFNRTSKSGKQSTIVLHVDDGLATCVDMSDLELLDRQLRAKYTDVKSRLGEDVIQYLGINFNFSSVDFCELTMQANIQSLVDDSGVKVMRKYPCTLQIWEIDDTSPLLDADRQERFYSLVYRGVYLSTRVRPDISLTTSFLATRVSKGTDQDWQKLMILCGYLMGTVNLGIRLRGTKAGKLACILYADASYGVHTDGKSHGGVVVSLGGGPVKAKSTKHKIVSKSSTEAELVELSDGVAALSATQQFLEAQGSVVQGEIREDNTSTKRLAEIGRPASQRTAHIRTRYFFVKMFLDNGEMSIVHCPTEDMVADVLTKPMVGEKFLRLRAMLLGYDDTE